MADLTGFVGDLVSKAQGKGRAIAERLRNRKKRGPKYPVSSDEAYALTLIDDAKRVRRATIESFETQWTKAILFTAGIQHIRYITTTRSFERPRATEEWMPYPVFNYIQPKVQRAVDFFTRNRPEAKVEPNSRHEDDRKAAALGEQIRQHLWDFTGDDDLFDEAAIWGITTGNAFKKNFIDTRLKNLIRIPRYEMRMEPLMDMMGQPLIGQDGQPTMVEKYALSMDPNTGGPAYDQVPEGVVSSYIAGPLQMTVPLAAPRLQDAGWCMETTLQDLEQMRQLFPDKADYIPETGHVLTSDLYQHRLSSLLTSGFHGVVRSIDPYTMEGFGVVNHYELAPCLDFPNGLLIVELDGVPLLLDELPLGNDFSWSHWGYYRVPGRFWFRGMVDDLIQPQEQLNKLEQFLQLNDGYNTNPVWLVPHEAGIAEGSVRNRPGQVIRYHYPYKPERQQGVSMPGQIIQRRAMYVQDMEEMSGVRNVLMGDAPPNVSAGVALNRLGEEAEGMFSPIEKRWERFIERDQTKKLQLAQRYYTVPRMISLRGGHGTIQEIHDFIGSQLRGNVNVRIEAGSYRPRSKAGRQQILIDTLNMGLLPGVLSDPSQHARFLEQLGVFGFEMPEGLDHKRASWENDMIVREDAADQIARQTGDNDLIHLQVHGNYRKTDDWLRLPLSIQQRHIQHDIQHILAILNASGETDTTNLEPREGDEEMIGAGPEEGPGEDGGSREAEHDKEQEGQTNA